MNRAVVLLTLVTGCNWVTLVPTTSPPRGPGDCPGACRNLRELGGCGLGLDDCEAHCEDVTEVEAEDDGDFPSGCLAAAKNCDEARSCR